jgi:hypothetical protein
MVTLVKDIEPGSMITFRSKNANDPTIWRGTLEIPTGTYKSIRRYGNPAAENQAVRQTDPTVPTDETTLTYFLITVDNDSTEKTERVFAQEWIQAGSLVVINPGNKVTLIVDDPNNDPLMIVSLLASAGYSSRIITT